MAIPAEAFPELVDAWRRRERRAMMNQARQLAAFINANKSATAPAVNAEMFIPVTDPDAVEEDTEEIGDRLREFAGVYAKGAPAPE